MTLHPEWRAILARAWSVHLMLLGGACDAVALGVTFFTGAPWPWSVILAVVGMLATFGGVLARIADQGGIGGAK